VLAYDKSRDVAIIKAHGVDFRTLTLGDSDRLQVGEEVVAIGNPLSLESTVSNGIVSAIRTVDEGKFVQITAPISPGSSGGPLFNMSGEVVGITTSHLVGGQNLNFAIPINDENSCSERNLHKSGPFLKSRKSRRSCTARLHGLTILIFRSKKLSNG
jgi:S1-C subfamily serine protease